VTTLSRLSALAVLPVFALALVGCAPGAGTGGTGTDGGSPDGGGAGGLDCSGVTTAGYELFVDPRLDVDPQLDVYPLEAGDSISFTDTPLEDVYTTYSYSLYYIDDSGSVFPNTGEIFVGAEDTGTFAIEGPVAPSGIDGGPYAGIVEIEATSGTTITVIARLCVALATSE
jgi:hypothetical protein